MSTSTVEPPAAQSAVSAPIEWLSERPDATVHSVARWLARAALSAAQRTPLRGVGGYTESTLRAQGDARPFPQAEREAARFRDLWSYFPGFDLHGELFDRVVLDFGSGYGGRTVRYAQACGPRHIWGVEPFENLVAKSQEFAAASRTTNCGFRLCTQSELPLADSSIDVVLSFDVLEHVADPRVSLAELWRVLKPGGKAFLVFPAYHGANSHHLDYIARVPGIHWLFRPQTLVAAVNDLIDRHGAQRWGVCKQPPPPWSFDGQRRVMPTLNGLTGSQFQAISRCWRTAQLRYFPLFPRHAWARALPSLLLKLGVGGRLRDALTGSIAAALIKDE